ncbi:unnamed protein product [Peniophora sp. CBMAI 1063]|nr:unnamed protein product [Peniophora sp. CBMAI 1063]
MHNRWFLSFLSAALYGIPLAQANDQLWKSLKHDPASESDAATAANLYMQEYTALDKFEHRSNCFRRVSAESLRGRCDRLEVDETARVRVALLLAICELKAASTHDELVPMECAAFAPEERAGAPDDTDPRPCTQAMLRSAQAWASFSGYHRDILPICAAMQHAKGIDRAMELFHNATTGNIALIHYFEARATEDEVFRDDWRDLHADFRQTSSELQMLQLRLRDISTEIAGEASELLNTVFVSGEDRAARSQARWEKVQEDSLIAYKAASMDAQNTFLGEIVARSQDLTTTLDHLGLRLASLHDDLERQRRIAGDITQDLGLVSTNVQAIWTATGDLSTDLSDGLSLSRHVRKEQENALREAVQLAQSLQLLTHSVHEATRSFEETVVEAIERLPATFARGVASLGHRALGSWLGDLGRLSLTSITSRLVVLVWHYPMEALVAYLVAYHCIPRTVGFVWWFITPLLGPLRALGRLIRYLRSQDSRSAPSCDQSSPRASWTECGVNPSFTADASPRLTQFISESPILFTPARQSSLELPLPPLSILPDSRSSGLSSFDMPKIAKGYKRAQSAPVESTSAISTTRNKSPEVGHPRAPTPSIPRAIRRMSRILE